MLLSSSNDCCFYWVTSLISSSMTIKGDGYIVTMKEDGYTMTMKEDGYTMTIT